jgi:hypothetical protein
MKTPTIADLSTKPYYVRACIKRGRRNKSGLRGFPSVRAMANALMADGWEVTLERRSDVTAGTKSGRIYITDPQDFFWTYFRAQKGGIVFERDCSSLKFSWVCQDIFRHYGYRVNVDTGHYELEEDN